MILEAWNEYIRRETQHAISADDKLQLLWITANDFWWEVLKKVKSIMSNTIQLIILFPHVKGSEL